MEYDEFRAMNTYVQVAAEGKREDLEPGFAEIRRLVAAYEEQFSRFRSTSELSHLNRASGRWFCCSGDMFELLQKAMEAYLLTDGLFDPSILRALEFAGYDRSFEKFCALGGQSFR